jgi:hypothetical protein
VRGAQLEITREQFDQQRRPRFGNANPERMRLAFWEWMIRGGENSRTDGQKGFAQFDLKLRDGKLKSGYGPYRAREFFNIPLNREDGPIWTFDRMGATRTELADGRVVCVGGEHEDFYDPDFFIYNDVVILSPEGEIEIYGYPERIFSPTDFHTATLSGNRIIIIGCVGYIRARRAGWTPVFSLDLTGYRLTEIKTSGEMPGWISEHDANLDADGIITVSGGHVFQPSGGKQRFRRNFEDYALDINSGVWRRLTDRNWRQFSIRSEEKMPFVLARDRYPKAEALLPRSIEHTVMLCDTSDRARFVIGGVPVALTIGVNAIEIIVEGDLPEELLARMAEDVRSNAEAVIQSRCFVDRL